MIGGHLWSVTSPYTQHADRLITRSQLTAPYAAGLPRVELWIIALFLCVKFIDQGHRWGRMCADHQRRYSTPLFWPELLPGKGKGKKSNGVLLQRDLCVDH